MTLIGLVLIGAVAFVAAAALFLVCLSGFFWLVKQCDNLP
jgi:hypothetical protein